MRTIEPPLQFIQDYYEEDLKDRSSPASRFYIPWLKKIQAETVLSLGCGPTLFDDAQFFGSPPVSLVGIDYNARNIEFLRSSGHAELLRCKELLKAQGTRALLIEGDMLIAREQFIGRFEAVYAVGSIGMQSTDGVCALLKNVKAYLKPGGLFLNIDWTDCLLGKSQFDNRVKYGWYSNIGPSIERLRRLIDDAGLKISEHEVFEIPDKETYGWGKVYAFAARG